MTSAETAGKAPPTLRLLALSKAVVEASYSCSHKQLQIRGYAMTPHEFRKLALSFPEAEERAHMNHPDFRVAGKIFATLGYPNMERGMVKVTPVEQEMLVSAEPSVFSPEAGAWGRKGCTRVNLKAAGKSTLRRAVAAAWQLAAPETLAKQFSNETAVSTVDAPRVNAGRRARRKVRRAARG